MQGQRSAVGSLPENLGFDNMQNPASNSLSDYVSSNNTGVTYLNSSSPEGPRLSGWSTGEPSSSAVQYHLSHNVQKTEHSWASSSSAGDDTILEDQQYAPATGLLLNNVNLSLSSNQIASVPMFVQSSGSDTFSQDLNGSAVYELQGADDCQIVECPLIFRSGSSENSRVQFGSSSSNPFGQRNHEHMVDNDIRATVPSLNGRPLSCKRKAIEGNIGQSSGSGSSTYFQDTEGSVWCTVPSQRNANSSLTISTPSDSVTGMNQPEQVIPWLGLDVRMVGSEIPPSLNTTRSAEISRRNFRLRISSLHQRDSIPTNVFTAASAVGSSSSSHRSARNPLHSALDLRSATAAGSASTQCLLAHVPAMRRNLQSSRWNRNSSSRPGSTPSFPEERNTTSHEESSSRSVPRNISEHPVFVPASVRNIPHNTVNWSLSGGSVTSSRNVSTSSVHQSSDPNWNSRRNSPQYLSRLSELVHRSLISSSGLESGSQNIDIFPPSSATFAASQDVAPSSGDDAHHFSHPRSAALLDRHLDGALAMPYPSRALASANEERNRLVSEHIRNVLDLMRRGEGLRFEDIMVLNQSIFFGTGDIQDRHRDMRLDVDNMSYEELLALEERIGNVNTGISEETISSFLKQQKYALIKTDQENAEPCCICQEEYKDEDFLGSLECGHDFHVDCIKQWLTHKNLCPICKTTALSTKGKP